MDSAPGMNFGLDLKKGLFAPEYMSDRIHTAWFFILLNSVAQHHVEFPFTFRLSFDR